MFLLRSGLRFSFQALLVPEPRVRKRPLSLTKMPCFGEGKNTFNSFDGVFANFFSIENIDYQNRNKERMSAVPFAMFCVSSLLEHTIWHDSIVEV